MNARILFSGITLMCLFGVSAFAQRPVAPAVPESAAVAAKKTVASPAPRFSFPPEAYTQPTNFLAIVNVNGAISDTKWLKEHCRYMQSQLSVKVKEVPCTVNPRMILDSRMLVKKLRAEHPDALMLVIAVKGENLPPVLASPYEYWCIMDAGWVRAGGGDAAQVNDRMGKRLFQALGHMVGAGYRSEREACMRYTPKPELLDEALSHGFHPMNSGIFASVANAVGLQPLRLRPRKELIEMGLFPARRRKAEPPVSVKEEK